MEKEDRTEVKEMLHDILSGYQALNESAFAVISSHLETIKEQTIKTNSRVNKSEDRLNALEVKEASHIVTCPQAAKIDKIKESLLEYSFLVKYPKVAFFLIAFLVIMFIVDGMKILKLF